ncbi:MAG: hypothetical protein KTR29_08450 [Rhodothermaceae bacterium]|nr:hypothetical protein [Rhodothermaceae bacterium]
MKRIYPLLLLVLVFSACDSTPNNEDDQSPLPGADFIRVTANPNPVQAEGAVVIRVTVADTTGENTSYLWSLPEKDSVTMVNAIRWQAPEQTGSYDFSVLVVNPPNQSANANFEIEVIR